MDRTMMPMQQHRATGRRQIAAMVGAAIGAAALSGCAMMAAPTGSISRAAASDSSWRDVATESDRLRIRDWWPAWNDALTSARANGFAAQIAAEGELLEPTAAIADPQLPNGDYRCRVIKLGTPAGTSLAYVPGSATLCRVAPEGRISSFAKLAGTQRHNGLIFPDTDRREIFLGTLAMGDETRALGYGADDNRNLAGIVERIGPSRWRIVLPRPAFESYLEVIELVPASG